MLRNLAYEVGFIEEGEVALDNALIVLFLPGFGSFVALKVICDQPVVAVHPAL